MPATVSRPAGARSGRVRIIGGQWRSRFIAFPNRPGLRPTPDRVRETLFNWLGQDLSGLTCLDLFAGSGALGFEAASRGAKRVVMVEVDRQTRIGLEETRRALGAASVEIVAGEALDFLGRPAGPFDVVFLDPPFRQNELSKVLERLPCCLAAGARVYIEAARPVEPSAGWRELKRKRAGQVSYQLLEYADYDRSRLSGHV
jgi:16S rRNA (guanine(966)-N(2))-methyltransferase RsmD